MVVKLFQSLTDRLRTLFVADVALDFEAELVRRQSERKHGLLRQADDLHERGYKSVAADLRQQAERLSIERPLASILPATAELSLEPKRVAVDSNSDQTAPRLSDLASTDKPSKRKVA